jgi:hypothetical protein
VKKRNHRKKKNHGTVASSIAPPHDSKTVPQPLFFMRRRYQVPSGRLAYDVPMLPDDCLLHQDRLPHEHLGALHHGSRCISSADLHHPYASRHIGLAEDLRRPCTSQRVDPPLPHRASQRVALETTLTRIQLGEKRTNSQE